MIKELATSGVTVDVMDRSSLKFECLHFRKKDNARMLRVRFYLYRMTQDDWIWCRRWFLRSLWFKKLIQYGSYCQWLRSYACFFFCHELSPVNQTSQVTIRDLETDGTGTVSESWNSHLPISNSQLALFTTERQRDLLPEVAFSKTCLKMLSVLTEGNFMKLG